MLSRLPADTHNETAPTEAPALPDIQVVEDTEAQLDPPSKVLLHNDDETNSKQGGRLFCLAAVGQGEGN